MGDNLPPNDQLLAPPEHAEALAAIERIRAGIVAADRPAAQTAQAEWVNGSQLWSEVGSYLLKQGDNFVTEAVKAAGRKIPGLIIAWSAIDETGHLLSQLVKALGG